MNMPIKSKHAQLLNDLADMQASPAYAVRRGVLAEAERVIMAQEREIARLNREIIDSEKEMRAEMREAAAEAMWKERLGEDYGSY